MSIAEPGLAQIEQARERIRQVVRRTPLHVSLWLSERLGVSVHLKLECWQRTGSFKLRGAYNSIASLDHATRARGLVTASAGNHGQAVALAAKLHRADATIFVPASAPEMKKERIRGFGAALREEGSIYDEAAAAARSFADETGAYYVHAFSDPAVVAGQATVALEILEELPTVRDLLVPVGGGGLVAGIGIAAKEMRPGAIRVRGVQSSATSSMHAAFAAGRVVETPFGETICDGLAGEVEPTSYARARPVVDSMVLVDEARVAPAIRELYRHEGIVAEGAGAVGVAAALEGTLDLRDPTVLVISGGNIDMKRLAKIFAGD